LTWITALLVWLLAAFQSPSAEPVPPPVVTTSSLYPEVKDRLTPERMEMLVARPLEALDRGDFEEAERRFTDIRSRAAFKNGPSSLEVADLEMSFGVNLFLAAKETAEGSRERKAAIGHLRNSVAAYRKHFGNTHPETALAVTSLADALGVLEGKGSLPERLSLIRESLAIRMKTLGPNNPETVANEVDMVRLLTDAQETDAKRFEEAQLLVAQIRSASLPNLPPGHELSPETIDLIAALPLIRLGRTQEAMTLVQRSEAKMSDGTIAADYCMQMVGRFDEIRDALTASGHQDLAKTISSDLSGNCLQALLESLISAD